MWKETFKQLAGRITGGVAVFLSNVQGFETSATWQSRERLIEAVSIGTRQADFVAKSLLVDYFEDAVSTTVLRLAVKKAV